MEVQSTAFRAGRQDKVSTHKVQGFRQLDLGPGQRKLVQMIEFLPSRAVALAIGDFQVHWYGVMYLLGFIISLILLPYLQRHRNLYLSRDEWAGLLSWAVVGVIVGGRLGYVLFYEPHHFAQHPREVLAVWNGGMSFHGGLLGVVLLLSFACYRKKISIARVADVVVVPVAIGLALGRFGNFINQELYGSVTTLPWGISIPGVEGLRHPTQIYAMLKDLLIASICYIHLRRTQTIHPGRTMALFLMLYGIGRFLVEYLRVQQYPLTELGFLTLTRGQLLTIPVFLAGVLLWVFLKQQELEENDA